MLTDYLHSLFVKQMIVYSKNNTVQWARAIEESDPSLNITTEQHWASHIFVS